MRIFENIDCMKGMDKYSELLKGRKVLAIVDPPYNITSWSATGNHSLSQKEIDKLKSWENPIDKNYFTTLSNFSINQIVWGGNHFFDFLGKATTFIVWDKKNRNCHFSDAELAWTSLKNGKVTIYDDYLKISGDRIHPTQKPIHLYKWILEKYAKGHDLILDTHVGSASSLIACEEFGIDYIGFELDTEYYNDAKKRIKKARFERECKEAEIAYTDDLGLFKNNT